MGLGISRVDSLGSAVTVLVTMMQLVSTYRVTTSKWLVSKKRARYKAKRILQHRWNISAFTDTTTYRHLLKY